MRVLMSRNDDTIYVVIIEVGYERRSLLGVHGLLRILDEYMSEDKELLA
jgi:hypothetical protein